MHSRVLGAFSLVSSLIILLLASIGAYHFVYNQFGGYDLSPLVDLSWRLSNGEIPGRDFINTMPIGILLAVKIISWGHLRWSDLTLINIFIVFITFIAIYVLPGVKRRVVLWLPSVALILCLPLIYTNHIWHSSLSQYFAIIFFYTLYMSLNTKEFDRKWAVSLFLSSAVMVLAKQNLAPTMLLLGVFLIIVCQRQRVRALSLFSVILGAIFGIVGGMLILGMSIEDFLYSYLAVLGRKDLDPSMLLAIKGVQSHWLLVGLMFAYLLLFFISLSRVGLKKICCLLLFLGLAIIPIMTDWDTKFNNVSLPLFIMLTGIYSSDSSQQQQDQLRRLLSIGLLIGIAIVATGGGYFRERMMHVGPFYDANPNAIIESGYFRRLKTGSAMHGILAEMNQMKIKYPNQKIYFGPRIEFGYMETGSESPKDMPLWFHPGTSYALSDQESVIKQFSNSNFEVLVFSKGDKTRMPQQILDFIGKNYHSEAGYIFLDIYSKNERELVPH